MRRVRSCDSSSLLARLAELVWCGVIQRTVWTYCVVFSSIPRPLRASVRYALEFRPLEKLIPQPTVECFDVSVLPGTRGRHGNRLRTDPLQPVRQRRTDELRTVVAPNPCRCPTPADDSGHDPPHFGPG